jgi:mannose-6-phosphate isomerase
MNRLLYPLENPIQNYAWGSHVSLATIRGARAPTDEPEAELWMGAHPSASSLVATNGRRSLLELTQAEPDAMLGAVVRSDFEGRLPFLLKLLAAAEPLSLQAHPTKAQARAGFAREEAAGIPRTAVHRNYKDDNHKPELLVALTPFHALVGFRDVHATLRLFERLQVARLEPLANALSRAPESAGLRAFFELAMTAEPAAKAELARATLDACRRLAGAGGEFSKELAWGVRIGEKYPGDPGLLVALALNLVELSPGDAIYLHARTLHAYLEGTGVEIMASSDNVLRGGLTPKHVDVPELLAVLHFRATRAELVAVEARGAEHHYQTPAHEFALSRLELEGRTSVGPVNGPEIVVVTSGSVTLERGTETLELPSGASAFVPAAGGDYSAIGSGTAFRAAVHPIVRLPDTLRRLR